VSEVLRHVIESIGPASTAHAEAACAKVTAANASVLERLAVSLGGAQHAATPRTERRIVVVCAGDHGAGDPGIALGASHPTVIAAAAIADGTAALCDVARAGRAPIVVVDAGAFEAAAMPASVIALGRGPTRDLRREPAMTVVDAALGLEAGIALAISLSEAGLDVLALGALGVGSELAAAALLGALSRRDCPTPLTGDAPHLRTSGKPELVLVDAVASGPDFPLAAERGEAHPLSTEPGFPLVDEPAWRRAQAFTDPEVTRAFERGHATTGSALELLAVFGGPETSVLAGLILGAASLHVPVILDGHATGAAALIAVGLVPAVSGYLVASHAGSPLHAAVLTQLGLAPIFEVGLGHGEGIGAALVFPWIDQVAALTGPR